MGPWSCQKGSFLLLLLIIINYYLKILNLRVKKNLNIEKITSEFVLGNEYYKSKIKF